MNPQTIANWQAALFNNYGNPLLIIGVALLVFPRLALGVSGFETGVSVMPLVRGEAGDDPQHPAGRIRNTKKLLTSAALIMSFYLITTSFITVVLIPAEEFERGGGANGRALAYLAHEYLGSAFGTSLRPLHHRDPGLCRRLGDGRAIERGSPLSAALRHGTRVG